MSNANKKPEKQGFLQKIVRNWMAAPAGQDWVLEAEWSRIQQRPVKATAILYIVALTLVALIIWAYLSAIDKVSRSQGKIIPSRQIQIVQSFDGGIVQEILVKEGQLVKAGELLLQVDPTRFKSNLEESASKFLAMQAKVERLTAQTQKRPIKFSEVLEQEVPETVENETKSYESNIAEFDELTTGYENRINQRRRDLEEFLSLQEQHESTLKLAEKELNVKTPLLESGAVSEMDLIYLERQIIEIKGDINKTKVAVRRAEAAIEEEISKQKENQLKLINKWNLELTEATAVMNALQESQKGLEDVVAQTEIRAPVDGTVQRLMYNTLGGVITPGSTVAEIIPYGDDLIIETKVSPKDIGFIKLGQTASVRFSAYDFTIYGGMTAEVEHISADAITDEKDETFYLVRLITDKSSNENKLTILPGMTVEVDIVTGERTILTYIINPFLKATSTAMKEQ